MEPTENEEEKVWYTRRNGEVHGPFPSGLISRYVLLGRVLLDDEISSDRQHWQTVKQVRHLIPDIMIEAAKNPDDPEVQEHLQAAKRWADEQRSPHKSETIHEQVDSKKGYLIVGVIVLIVAMMPFLIPEDKGVEEPQCDAPPVPGVIWRDCLMQGGEFPNADLAGANLRNANLTAAVLRASNLSGADLAYATLHHANLRGANLTGASMVGTNLRRTDLSSSNLSEADLSYADLTGAVLENADLTATKLDNAILSEGIVCGVGSVGQCLNPATGAPY